MATVPAKRELTVQREAMQFDSPLRISGYVFDSMPSIVATVEQGESLGRGEAAGVYYLGDDQDRMVAAIEEIRPDVEAGLGRQDLQSALPPCGARNALDCALWELEAQLSGKPVWALAGISQPKPLVTVFTITAGDRAEVEARTTELAFAKAIKLKLDGNVEADRERLEAVRRERPDVWLSVDANQGYCSADLDSLSRLLAEFNVTIVEQPVARGKEAILEGWNPGIPVAADESILDLAELRELGPRFDVINIKLDKCGGLTEALAMAREARAMGKQVMVGNMGGSTLAMAPGFVVGQLCDVVDLDGPFALMDDPLASSIYSNGNVFVPESVWGGAAGPHTRR
jgi:L-alanine-DL-glutamate epimerase-like enolase superfamily enzyme